METRPAVYFPVQMASGWTNLTFTLRTAGDPGNVMGAGRARVRVIDPLALILNEITAEQMLARQTAPTRAILQLIGAFAGLGLAMAAIGVIAALGAGRFLAGVLYGVPLADPLTIGGVTLILCATALLASYLPARRAAKVDPTIALRSD